MDEKIKMSRILNPSQTYDFFDVKLAKIECVLKEAIRIKHLANAIRLYSCVESKLIRCPIYLKINVHEGFKRRQSFKLENLYK